MVSACAISTAKTSIFFLSLQYNFIASLIDVMCFCIREDNCPILYSPDTREILFSSRLTESTTFPTNGARYSGVSSLYDILQVNDPKYGLRPGLCLSP